MVWDDLKPSDILSAASFDNAVALAMAVGGSTNCIIHLVAMAARAGVDLPLSRFDEISRHVPVIANLRPKGKYLMEAFYFAGGIRALLGNLASQLKLDCMTVNGATVGANIERAKANTADRSRPIANPVPG